MLLPILLLACASETGWEHDYAQVPSSGPEQACEDDGDSLTCEHHESRYRDGNLSRQVRWQLPPGEPPEAGWPVVLVFQGTGHASLCSFEAGVDDLWGGWWQARLTAELLTQGFAVIAPGTRGDGTWWDTNVLPWSQAWESSRDHRLMLGLLAGIEEGVLGPLDSEALHATGISSGGYMTSRMAVSYGGRFEALAIQSASYATCGGLLCSVPELPADHPPTLFLHGDQDEVVPVGTMRAYLEALEDQDTEVDEAIDEDAHHGWLELAPDRIPDWFLAH